MDVKQIAFSRGMGGFFFDDQAAIKNGLSRDGFLYQGKQKTPGFRSVRVPSESISVALILNSGQVAFGDCCAVQYSGVDGRDQLFLSDTYTRVLDKEIKPYIIGIDPSSFRKNAELIDSLRTSDGKLMHTAIRYGVTQALLDAAAKARQCTMTEVVTEEYGLTLDPKPLRIFAQSGDEVRNNADKMILKRVDVMPHGLINNPREKFGTNGEELLELVGWLKQRILKYRPHHSYFPEMHFDVYGIPGMVFRNNIERIVDYLAKLETEAYPFSLRIEAPIDAGSRDGQVEALKKMREFIESKGILVEIVADEWCNTLEDIKLFASESAGHMIQIKPPDLGGINRTIEATIFCKEKGMKAYQGGSCTETDISSRICTQIALATQPYQILAKPGMGVDEGYMIVKNEMLRTISLLQQIDE